MAKCAMCGKEIPSYDTPEVFCTDNSGKEYKICEKCAWNVSEYGYTHDEAYRKYITECMKNSDNEAMKIAVSKLWNQPIKNRRADEIKKSLSESKPQKEPRAPSVPAGASGSYSYAKSDSTRWVSWLRSIFNVLFVLICIAAVLVLIFYIKINYDYLEGYAILIGVGLAAAIFIVGVLLLGGMMVFLDMADDVHKIRYLLENKRDK